MSFSVFLNSNQGTEVAGAKNQIIYNFDWSSTPEHSGGYRVSMTFASEQQTYIGSSYNFGRVSVDLGYSTTFTPISAQTATRHNQVLGFIRPSMPQFALTNSVPSVTSTATASVPVNSGTTAYTLTTTNVIPTYIVTSTAVQTIDARHADNPPIYLPSKPSNNQFLVKIQFHDGVLYTPLTAHYGMLITFEAIK